MTRWLPVAAVLALLLGTGVAHGIRNDRWSTSTELATMVERLPTVPMRLGDWIGEDDSNPKLTERLKRSGTVHEMVQRVYRDSRNGDVVTVLLATGRPGPISTHTPETCIGQGGAWVREAKAREVVISQEPRAAFARCNFSRTNAVSQLGMTVYWSWHDPKKGWVTVKDPRVAFGADRVLTKIYVTQNSASGGNPGRDAAARFLRECLPLIDQALYDTAPAAPDTSAPAPAAIASA